MSLSQHVALAAVNNVPRRPCGGTVHYAHLVRRGQALRVGASEKPNQDETYSKTRPALPPRHPTTANMMCRHRRAFTCCENGSSSNGTMLGWSMPFAAIRARQASCCADTLDVGCSTVHRVSS